MKLRDDFFAEPMIRATPAKHLNDPFEGCFNQEQVRDAYLNHQNHFKKLGEDVWDELDDNSITDSMGFLESDINELGVISLTESYNNTLMWAHYGDEHKGVVVEFDFDVPFFHLQYTMLTVVQYDLKRTLWPHVLSYQRK